MTVCVPARDEAETIGPIVRDIVALQGGVVDQVLVADHDSVDGTGQIAAGLGAEVVRTGALMRELGPPAGKGDNLWRALTAVRGEVVCFVDGDSADFGPHFVCGLIGPLVCKARDRVREGVLPSAVARPRGREADRRRPRDPPARGPLLGRFYPDLLAFDQPLAGEMAARRTLFEAIPTAPPGTGSRSGC